MPRDIEQGVSTDDEMLQCLVDDNPVRAGRCLFDDDALHLGEATLNLGGKLRVLAFEVLLQVLLLNYEPEERDIGGQKRQHELGSQVVDAPGRHGLPRDVEALATRVTVVRPS